MSVIVNRRRVMGIGGEDGFPLSTYIRKYLTMQAIETGTFSVSIDSGCSSMTISYSLDNGVTWIDNAFTTGTAKTYTTPNISAGDSVIWKCISADGSFSNSYDKVVKFSSTMSCKMYGNILSLIYGDAFIGKNTLANGFQTFRQNFINLKVVDAEYLIIPVITMKQYVAIMMFDGNTNLVKGPALVSDEIQTGALQQAFRNNTHLASLTIIAGSVSNNQNNWAANVPSGGVLTREIGNTFTLLPTGWTFNDVLVV